ncbi:hypothetical protein [Pseudomonas japonica]|uniref:Uncharacterized protein n=1 Tax=Pseudomonas japonica TaxID=256466 RepID=A0A239AA46_9PSED|nr:hypothetical protein [Pseudomonas japonica]SNR91753.1 hypothetical protein SAMN05444352_101258 [Pseudomonas japonica]
MHKTLPNDPTYRGLFQHHPEDSSQIPFQTRVWCQYVNYHIDMIEMAPWGLILPEETVQAGFPKMIEIETLGMPANSKLLLRWTPHDGSNPRTLDFTLFGDGQVNTSLRIPDSWLREDVGKDVLVECEVTLPDGRVEVGRSFNAHLAKALVDGEMIVADLKHGDTLKPEDYPDGLTVRIDPIENIRDYHPVVFEFQVDAILQGGSLRPVNHWQIEFIGTPGEAYEFIVPPEAYTGFGDPAYQGLIAMALPGVKLVPRPTLQFWYGLGGQVFDVMFSTRK